MTEIANQRYFAFILLVGVTVGVVLQFICALNFSINGTFFKCIVSSNVTEEGETVRFHIFRDVAWIAFVTEFIAFVMVCAKLKCCAQHFCVPSCGENCWTCCNACGNGWFVFSVISVFLNMIGMITLHTYSTSCVMSIIAFQYAIANIIIGTVKVFLYIAFLSRYGCPDTSKFLGSDKELADYSNLQQRL